MRTPKKIEGKFSFPEKRFWEEVLTAKTLGNLASYTSLAQRMPSWFFVHNFLQRNFFVRIQFLYLLLVRQRPSPHIFKKKNCRYNSRMPGPIPMIRTGLRPNKKNSYKKVRFDFLQLCWVDGSTLSSIGKLIFTQESGPGTDLAEKIIILRK